MTATQTAASAFALAPGFATGGKVSGPGTGTSDDVPAWLSDGEFITREAVVSQPGALAFLDDFTPAAWPRWTTTTPACGTPPAA